MALRFAALALAAALAALPCLATPARALDAYWTEPAYAAHPARGPAKALGLVIWNHGVDGQLPIASADDLALLTEGAGDHMDVGATSDVMRDSAASGQAFVVRMRVDEQKAWRDL